MKLNITTDFTKLPKAHSVLPASGVASHAVTPADIIVLPHDDRHLRRKVLTTVHDEKLLVDLPEPVQLRQHDRLVLDDGRHIEIMADEEELLEARPRDAVHLAELCWHIGNRHLAAQIEADRLLILRDHVIKAMLEGLGAAVKEVSEPFEPVRGAYSGHSHDHDHHGHDHHAHDHHGHDHHHGHRDHDGHHRHGHD